MLHEVIGWSGPMTHRQFRTWQEWLRRQWNRPDRHDHYLMQIAAMGCSSSMPLEKFKIPFQSSDVRKVKATEAEINLALSRSLARAGKEPRVRLPDGTLVPLSQYKGAL